MVNRPQDTLLTQNSKWWVDEIGGFHCAEDVDVSFDSLFLRHLGQLKLQVEWDKLRITWDIGKVSSVTIACVIARLNELSAQVPVLLRYYYHGWAEELCTGPEALNIAAQRIATIQRFKSVELACSTHIKVHNLDDIQTASSVIQQNYRLWQDTEGNLGKASQEECSSHLPNIVMYRPDAQTGNLVFSWVGTQSLSAVVHGRSWAATAIRHDSVDPLGSERPDYVTQVSSAYQNVWHTGEPHYSHIRTLLTPQDREPSWLSYQRLLTRFNLHDGRPALFCLSMKNNKINIPLAGAS